MFRFKKLLLSREALGNRNDLLPECSLTSRCCFYLLTAFAAIYATPLMADTILDPLHGYSANATQGLDNGTNSPISGPDMAAGFGFSISPGPQTGSDFLLDVLVPNNPGNSSLTVSVTPGPNDTSHTLSATLPLVSASSWTSGDLDTYLGISASPSNPIGSFLPSTNTLDAAATGFFVYQFDLGTTTLSDPSTAPSGTPAQYFIPASLPAGSYVVGFLDTAVKGWIATADSGALFLTSAWGGVPEPASLAIWGVAGLAGLPFLRRKKAAA